MLSENGLQLAQCVMSKNKKTTQRYQTEGSSNLSVGEQDLIYQGLA